MKRFLTGHRLGLRIIKTGIAVTVCVVAARLLGLNEPLVAVVATILSMGKSIDISVRSACYKMIGVVIGCVVGGVFSMISHGNAGLCGIGVIGCLYLCHLLKLEEGGLLSCFTFAAVMFTGVGTSFWPYALACGENALLGIAVAVVVNLAVMPPNYGQAIHRCYETLLQKIKTETEHAAARTKIDIRPVEAAMDQLNADIHLYVRELKPLRGDDADVFAISCRIVSCRMIADELRAVSTLKLAPDRELTETAATVYRYHMDRIREFRKSLEEPSGGDGAPAESPGEGGDPAGGPSPRKT